MATEYSARSYRRERITEPIPPPSPTSSPEIRLLLAWIDAHLNQSTERGQMAYWESALLREQALAAGKLSAAARYLTPETDPRLLEIFALPSQQMEDEILGYWDGEGNWQVGLAGLTPREQECVSYALRGLDYRDIAREMTPKKFRHDPSRCLAQQTVENKMVSARAKLRKLLNPVLN